MNKYEATYKLDGASGVMRCRIVKNTGSKQIQWYEARRLPWLKLYDLSSAQEYGLFITMVLLSIESNCTGTSIEIDVPTLPIGLCENSIASLLSLYVNNVSGIHLKLQFKDNLVGVRLQTTRLWGVDNVQPENQINTRQRCLLLSKGMDSYIAVSLLGKALDYTYTHGAAGHSPATESISLPPSVAKYKIAHMVSENLNSVKFKNSTNSKNWRHNTYLRTRVLAFTLEAATVLRGFGEIVIGENGAGILNASGDPDRPSEVNISLRSTHIAHLNEILNVFEFEVSIVTPYIYYTKSMLIRLLPNEDLSRLCDTVSCTDMPYGSDQQCGSCGACVYRRLSLKLAGVMDRTSPKYKVMDLYDCRVYLQAHSLKNLCRTYSTADFFDIRKIDLRSICKSNSEILEKCNWCNLNSSLGYTSLLDSICAEI